MKHSFVFVVALAFSVIAHAGTPKFVSDLNPIPLNNAGVRDLCSEFIRFSDLYYFCGNSESGMGLWTSDGTTAGTVNVSDQFAPDAQIIYGNKLFFIDQSSAGLFGSDGTADGTALVKDFSHATFIAELNGNLLLAASDGITGVELWISDGTTDGTSLLRDIVPGQTGFRFDIDASDFVHVNNKVFFTIDDRSNGDELWVTEGTTETTRLVKDIQDGSSSSNPSNLTAFNSSLVFIADDGNSSELWITNGTEAGTLSLSSFGGGTALIECGSSKITQHNGLLFFCARGDLWTSDGTVAGTSELKNLGTTNFRNFLISADNNLFFTAQTSSRSLNIWVSDGSEAGTVPLTDTDEVSLKEVHALSTNGGEFLFISELDDTGVNLWQSDTANQNVKRIKDFDTQLGPFAEFFNAFTRSETALLGSSESYDYFILDINDDIPTRLWKTDGSNVGTVEVGAFPADAQFSNPENTLVEFFYTFGSDAFFAADDPSISRVQRIWVDNSAGLEILKELTPLDSIATRSTRMSEAVIFQDHFYFLTANAPNSFSGMSLWKSDGTETGTVLVKELCEISCRFRFEDAEIVATQAGIFILILNEDLWFSDGTSDGTNFVTQVGSDQFGSLNRASKLTSFGDSVIFAGWDDSHGTELWISDGTFDGTTVVKDIKSGPADGLRSTPGSDRLEDLTEFAVMGGNVYFVADDNLVGPELWKSNGTEDGTTLVKDIFALGNVGSFPQDITVVGDTLYFAAFSLPTGYELWKSNGTANSTSLVKDIEPSTFTVTVTRIVCEVIGFTEFCRDREVEEQRPYSSLPKSIMAFGNKAVFRAHTLANGYETWITDGTDIGTTLLKDINAGPEGSVDLTIPPTDGDFNEDIDNILRWKENLIANGELFFTARQNTGRIELWKTDGSTLGTNLVRDIGSTGFSGEQIEQLSLNTNNLKSFFFTVKSSDNETRLWQSNGEPDGTNEFTEQPNPALSEFDDLFFFNDRLFFSATNGIKGLALWSLVPDSDRDGFDDLTDNCQNDANPAQQNYDNDLLGDICDPDDDNDGVVDSNDAFPFDASETTDTDSDGIGNNTDPDDDNDLVNDLDEFGEPLDNCPFEPNPDQKDDNNDGVGNACEESELCVAIRTKSNTVSVICL